MDAERLSVDPAALERVPLETCRKYTLVPVGLEGGTLTVAMHRPADMFAIDDLRFMTGLEVVPVLASKQAILAALAEAAVGGAEEPAEPVEDPIGESVPAAFDPSPVVAAVNRILIEAIQQRASHVYVEPTETDVRVGFRVDGVRREFERLPIHLRDSIVSRLKIMSKLDIAEKRLPQDGRITIAAGGVVHDVRTVVMPVLFGELFTLRFVVAAPAIAMADLGFPADVLAALTRALELPAGLVLFAGPSRSGRSTTLYAVVERLNDGTRLILTAEDPVRRYVEGVSQSQLRRNIGYDAAAALRTFRRFEPDVVMVSRIEEADAAQEVIESAGHHLVLSSIAADSAAAALVALVRFGCHAARTAGVVRLVLAQRLVRRICGECRIEDSESRDASELDAEIPGDAVFFTGAGCRACRGSGYRGRLPIVEMMPISGAVRAALTNGGGEPELQAAALAAGMRPFVRAAVDAAVAGQTTLDECWRVKAQIDSA